MTYNLSDYTPYIEWIDQQTNRLCLTLIELSNINSGSYNTAGLDKICRYLEKLFMPLEGKREILSIAPMKQVNNQGELEEIGLGKALRIIKRPDAPLKVFLGVHMDTVFPLISPFQKAAFTNDHMITGPGVADAKGGILVLKTALEALEKSPWANNIGWEVLLNPDEEIGSPGSERLFEIAAKNNDLGLLFEPSFPDGSLASDRKGSGGFAAVVRGKAAHAGREFDLGRNSIRALSDFVQMIDDLNSQRDEVIVNPGYINGGGPVNIVPDLAVLKFNVRVAQSDDEKWVNGKLQNVVNTINSRDGLSLELHGKFNRKPKELSPVNKDLLMLIRECGESLGMEINWQPTGGCCDGNNLAAAGLPNVDNLGVRGGNIHSVKEYMHPDSLTERAKLTALFLMKLAKGEMTFPKAS